ncbi:MAG: mechanosensitive ion channel [Bacteroidaceae bacterium]|nr:mechanosensitive ion channel [Bacteroidaceae bacterium]MBR4303035.1 mechanosensitive ion channel [Bacteroidaceae bacterium]
MIKMLLAQSISEQDILAADSIAAEKMKQTVEMLKGMSVEDAFSFILKSAVDFAWDIFIAILIFLVGRWIIRYIDKILNKVFVRKEVEVSLAGFIRSFVKGALYIVLIITLIKKVGVDTSSFVALLASAGVAIGMALSGTFQNFAGGILILLLRPFKVGDYILTQGFEGTVKEIRLFNTLMSTTDNKQITIPNSNIINNVINNSSAETRRRIDLNVTISYGDDYDVARAALLDIVNADSRIEQDPNPPYIALSSLGDSAVNVLVRVWVPSSEYWSVYHGLNEKIYKQLPEKGIHFPFPQLDVRITQ